MEREKFIIKLSKWPALKGLQSLYIDFSLDSGKSIHKHPLKYSLYENPMTDEEREYNRTQLERAMSIESSFQEKTSNFLVGLI